MIEAGQIVFVKTISEPVFVVRIIEATSGIPAFPLVADVRRPVMTENGILHQMDTFWLQELETLEEQRARIQKEFLKSGFSQKLCANENEKDTEALFAEITKTPPVN